MSSLPIIIDTDPGLGEPGSVIDDGLAIAFALASSEVRVLGLTIVAGNVDAPTGYALAQNLLCRLGRSDIGVHHEDAGRWMAEQVAARPGEITIAAIGPLTNVAEALRIDPGFAANVKEVVVMAGNATGRLANGVVVENDFNVFIDPAAADAVFGSGAAIRMVGIDQTSRVLLTAADAARLRDADAGDGVNAWLADCVQGWIAHETITARRAGEAFCLLHDPLVVAAITHPELLVFEPVDAAVSAAVDTDVTAFTSLFLTRLTRPQPEFPKEAS